MTRSYHTCRSFFISTRSCYACRSFFKLTRSGCNIFFVLFDNTLNLTHKVISSFLHVLDCGRLLPNINTFHFTLFFCSLQQYVSTLHHIFFLLVQLHNPLLDDSFKSALFQFIQRIIVFSSSMQYIPVIPVVSFTHLMLFFTKPQKNKNKVFFFSLLSFFLGLSSPSLTRLHRLNHVNPRLVRINPPDW